MIIAVNVGNTNTAVFCSGKTILFPTSEYSCTDDFISLISDSILKTDNPDGGVFASVVPEKSNAVASALEAITGHVPISAGAHASLNIDISHYDAALLGADRIAACCGAAAKYSLPAVVFDFGTATTANVLSAGGVFLGGAIVPGVSTMLKSLSQNTAQLPYITPQDDIRLIGSNTRECMLAGAYYATAEFAKGYLANVSSALGESFAGIVTGGNAAAVRGALPESYIFDKDLVFYGLMKIYELNA